MSMRNADGIQDRSYKFALRVLKAVQSLPATLAGQTVAKQLARSGMSVGANVEEAQGSMSRADFVRRMTIARSEAMEARYWLRLSADSGLLPRRRLGDLIDEADQIVRILVAIVRTAKGRGGRSNDARES